MARPDLKITPGPWTVDLDREFILGGDTVAVEATSADGTLIEREICTLWLDTDDHPDGPQWTQDCANARAISAVPELLELAYEVLAFQAGMRGGWADCVRLALRATAKVKGVAESEVKG